MAKSTTVGGAGHLWAIVATNAIVQAISKKVARLLIALCAVVLVDLPEDSAVGAPPNASTFGGKMEIKLVVPPDKVAGATKILKLEKQTAVEGEIVFFDTEDGALFAKNLILRARQKTDGLADSTVKLRTAETPLTSVKLRRPSNRRRIGPAKQIHPSRGLLTTRFYPMVPCARSRRAGRRQTNFSTTSNADWWSLA
jgi:hypothetical protein